MKVSDYLKQTGPEAMNERDRILYADMLTTLDDEELNREYKSCKRRTMQDMIIRELHRRSEVPA